MKVVLFCVLVPVWLLMQTDRNQVKGVYKVVFDKEFNSDESLGYVISFKDNTYVKKLKDGKEIKGKIKRMPSPGGKAKTVYLKDLVEYTPVNHLDSLIYESFGDTIIEFEESNEDTLNIRTTYQGNLHVTVNQGKLIRIK